MPLTSGAQLILQIERPAGFECRGYSGLPLMHPAFIAIASSGTPCSQVDVAALHRALLLELGTIAPGMLEVSVPCQHTALEPSGCHALGETNCQKLLVLVGDRTVPTPLPSFASRWLSGDPSFCILPVFHEGSRTGISHLLPRELSHVNVLFWSHSVDEAIPQALTLSGLIPDNPRVFISYRQRDTALLAVQLFDALAHAGVDVFLDHFRIAPGLNFQARLTQELGDKAMVLLLESEHILDSEWTLYEIGVAKTAGLGLIAVQVPNGIDVPGVDSDVRVTLGPDDLVGTELTPAKLTAVVDRVKREHARALIRRRQILQGSLEGALLEHGISVVDTAPRGLRVIGRSGKHYLVWLTPRQPELPDFHAVHGHIPSPAAVGVVIGLARLMEPARRVQTEWLAGISGVRLVDEGRIREAALTIADGTL